MARTHAGLGAVAGMEPRGMAALGLEGVSCGSALAQEVDAIGVSVSIRARYRLSLNHHKRLRVETP